MIDSTVAVRSAKFCLRVTALAVSLGCVGSQPAMAQSGGVITIAPDAQVRVTPVQGAGARVTGRFLSLTADTLAFTTGDRRTRFAMPAATVQRLEVRSAHQRQRGAVAGASILGGIAVIFGGIDMSNGSLKTGDYLGTIAGNAVIGALAGAALAPRGWVAVR